MRRRKHLQGFLTLLLIFYLFYGGLIPQTVFRDCIRAVETQEEESGAAEPLTQEEWIKLYNLSKNNTKTTLKTVKMIDENG